MYSPWTTSMPCLFSKTSNSPHNRSDCLINSFTNLDLSNPFNLIANSSDNLNYYYYYNQSNNEEKEMKTNYFEPLPFFETHNQTKQNYQPQLSQKHTMIKQMIARNEKQLSIYSHSYSNSYDNLISTNSHRLKRQICTFCKSNGESANVYTSHVLRNGDHEIQCPILLAYVCPKCGATGKSAHTIKYCTALSENERVALPTVKTLKEGRSSSGNKNLFKK
ncbi:hypothetical protein I4U23_006332 [Adineta vaga]|nr:hypothetical protein I4U23_006332 [Adineta vaga]